MVRYSESLEMLPATIGAKSIERSFPGFWVPRPFPHAPVWARLGTTFDLAHFMAVHPPVQLGKITGCGIPASAGPRKYLRVHIKSAHSETVQIPEELQPILPILVHALETFAAHHPDWVKSWAHVTWDADWVEPGQTHRVPGWHVDGMQGPRSAPHRSEASVLWSDELPTEYCIQPFVMSHLDPARHNVHDACVQQAREVNACQGYPNGLYLIDPYVVHRAAIAQTRVWRNFVRVTVSDMAIEDPQNTVNLGLKGVQGGSPRLEVRDRLFAPPSQCPWEAMGWHPSNSA